MKTLHVNNGPVKELSLHDWAMESTLQALELLLELQELTSSGSDDTGDPFTSFIDTRQNAGRPVTLHHGQSNALGMYVKHQRFERRLRLRLVYLPPLSDPCRRSLQLKGVTTTFTHELTDEWLKKFMQHDAVFCALAKLDPASFDPAQATFPP